MRTHFSQLFWGLLLVILDISINKFDLFADGIGYLIVAGGCRGLSAQSPRFSSARTLSLVLAALWLIGIVLHGEIAAVYGIVTMVVNCTLIWQLLGGIAEFAINCQRTDIASRAYNRRVAYVYVMAGSTCFALVLNGSRGGGLLVVLLVVAMLVLMVMILHLIHRVKVELAH